MTEANPKKGTFFKSTPGGQIIPQPQGRKKSVCHQSLHRTRKWRPWIKALRQICNLMHITNLCISRHPFLGYLQFCNSHNVSSCWKGQIIYMYRTVYFISGLWGRLHTGKFRSTGMQRPQLLIWWQMSWRRVRWQSAPYAEPRGQLMPSMKEQRPTWLLS